MKKTPFHSLQLPLNISKPGILYHWVCLFLLLNHAAYSQNLAPNPVFEEHHAIRYSWQPLWELMSSWQKIGFEPVVFDTRYRAG
jgi:hypothetical protein